MAKASKKEQVNPKDLGDSTEDLEKIENGEFPPEADQPMAEMENSIETTDSADQQINSTADTTELTEQIEEIVEEKVSLSSEDLADTEDKVEEYFDLKEKIKTLRQDLKDHKENHIDYEELQEVAQKAKELRDNIKHDEDIMIIQDKVGELKERMDMLKEIIKMRLVENDQVEVKRDGRKLKLVPVLKEMKDEEASLN